MGTGISTNIYTLFSCNQQALGIDISTHLSLFIELIEWRPKFPKIKLVLIYSFDGLMHRKASATGEGVKLTYRSMIIFLSLWSSVYCLATFAAITTYPWHNQTQSSPLLIVHWIEMIRQFSKLVKISFFL